MNYQKQYADKINWKNSPDTSTPLNATNLNKMDNALWYMDSTLYTISKAIGGGSSARGGIISNVGNNAFTTHVHQRIGESLAENELLILRSDVSGTGNSINVYTDSSSAVGFGLLDLDGESTSITVTTDSVVVLMITDADTDYTAQVLAVIDTAGGVAYSGLGIGKKTGVSSNVIDTDIDLHRAPMAGDRLLVYFDEKITNPTGLKTYNNGVAVTSNLENATPLYINAGWNILEFKNDGLLYNNVWVRKQNVPVPSTLAGMSDTLIVSPSNDQLLVYDDGKWKNQKYIEANVGFSDTELKKIKVGDIVYDTDGLRDYFVTNIANNNITISVLNSNQFVMENIAINTGNHSGSSNGWNLVISDGLNPVSVALKNADGSPFADDIHENELLFVYVDTAGNIARVLEIHSHDLEILKDAIITEKTVSGNPITITDALPYPAVTLSAEIEAEQDLHGYGHPWVGGAGKNKCPYIPSKTDAGITVTTAEDGTAIVNGTASAYFYTETTITLKAGNYIVSKNASGDFPYLQVRNKSTDALIVSTGAGGTETAFTLADDTKVKCRLMVSEGATLDNVKVYPMIRLSTESSAYAPYSNICPISGRDSVVVDDTGANLIDPTAIQSGGIDAGGHEISVSGFSRTGYTPVNDAIFALIGSTAVGYTVRVHGYNASKQWVEQIDYFNSGAMDKVYTIPNGIAYIRVSYPTNGADFILSQGHAVTIQLGTTVYGGTLNVTTGVMTVKTACETFDNTTDWPEPSDRGSFAKQLLSNDAKAHSESSTFEGISNCLAARSGDAIYNGAVGINCNGRWLGFRIAGVTTRAELIAFTTATPIQVEYPLANPFTIQLTPTDLQMLKGYNRLSSDGGGDITLTYKANRLAAIEAALAALSV